MPIGFVKEVIYVKFEKVFKNMFYKQPFTLMPYKMLTLSKTFKVLIFFEFYFQSCWPSLHHLAIHSLLNFVYDQKLPENCMAKFA